MLSGEGGVLITVLVHGDPLLPIIATVLMTGVVLVAQYGVGSHDEVGCAGGVAVEGGADGGPGSLCPGPLLLVPGHLPGDEGLLDKGASMDSLIFLSGDPSKPSWPCFPNLKVSVCLTNVPDSFPQPS